MGTSANPDPEVPLETPPVESALPSPSTQPTPSPTAPAIDPAYVRLLEGTIAAQNSRIGAIEAAAARGTVPAAPPQPVKTKDELRQEFFDDPITANRKLIREEMNESISELRDFVREFRGGSKIDSLIQQFKLNPKFAPHWTSAVEQYVREQAAQVKPEVLDQSFGFLVASAIGLKTAGLLGDNTPAPAPIPTTPVPVTPPVPSYVRPSAPASPNGDPPKPKHRELDENEKMLLRDWNNSNPSRRMTEEQFLKWQAMPSAEVAFTDFDKPKPPKP